MGTKNVVLLLTSEMNQTLGIRQSSEHSSVIESEEEGEKLNCDPVHRDI